MTWNGAQSPQMRRAGREKPLKLNESFVIGQKLGATLPLS
jgi:hypothetical protein